MSLGKLIDLITHPKWFAVPTRPPEQSPHSNAFLKNRKFLKNQKFQKKNVKINKFQGKSETYTSNSSTSETCRCEARLPVSPIIYRRIHDLLNFIHGYQHPLVSLSSSEHCRCDALSPIFVYLFRRIHDLLA